MAEQGKFIGRGEELAQLENLYSLSSSQMIVVYGRRRIGKSTLLAHFCEGKSQIFFTGRKGENQRQLVPRFLKEVGEFYKNPLISMAHPADWSEIFGILDIARRGKKLILVLDEFQWMCSRASTLISALQEHWDKKWKGDKGIFLVLCGSIVSFMERDVLSEKSPLYGRRTASMEIGPLAPREARSFFPRMGRIGLCELIMTFGGVPSYLEVMDRRRSLAQNINALALTKGGYFVDEVQFILREQLKNPNRYYLILRGLSQRPMSKADLAKWTGIANSGALNLYLKTLVDLKLVKQLIPIDKPATAKTQRYAIWDEFVRFYFSYVLPNREAIEMNSDDWLYDRLVAPAWSAYCGYSFEIFCMKNVKAIVELLGIKDVFRRSGTYWRAPTSRMKGVQIDMVIERSDAVTHLIECRWSAEKVGSSIVEEIGKKMRLYPNPEHRTLKAALITTQGVTEAVKGSGALDAVITIDDML